MASGTRSQVKDKEAGGSKQPISSVFFEKQEGRLCAQHCINNALQEAAVDAVLLSSYAQSFDEAERKVAYDEANLDNGESNNYDDTGYFSVQVIQSALAPYDLDLVNINEGSTVAATARNNPVNSRLYIFHEKDHWFCARRFAEKQWILLNSLKEPVEISDRDLSSMVTTKVKGRQVFLVSGFLKDSAADAVYSRVMKDAEGITRVFTDTGKSLGTKTEEEELQEALALSLGKTPQELLRERRAKFLANLEKKQDGSGSNDGASPRAGNQPSSSTGKQ